MHGRISGALRSVAVVLALVAVAAPSQAASISASASVQNFTSSSQTFEFVFGTPIAPIAGFAAWTFTGTVQATDTGENGSVTVAPALTGGYFFRGLTTDGVTPIAFAEFGTTTYTTAGTYNVSGSGTFDCALYGGCDDLQLAFGFTVSGFDQATFAGRLDLVAAERPTPTPVPEPAGLGLLLLAVLGASASRFATRGSTHAA